MASNSEVHEDIACDSELLCFFDAGDFVSLSVAISAGLGAEVSFPDREDDELNPAGDDTATELDITVYDQSEWLTYPFTASALLERVIALYLASGPRRAWSAFEQQVLAVEGVGVGLSRKPFAPREHWDDILGGSYEYVRAAPGTMTVATWRTRRAALPTYFDCEVRRPDRSIASGRTQMKSLRAAWEAGPPEPEPTMDERIHDVFRTARLFAIVERARSTD